MQVRPLSPHILVCAYNVLFLSVCVDATSSCWCLMLQELFKHTLSAPHVSYVIVM